MTTPCSFRPDDHLHARIERRAALEGMTKAQFLDTAVRHYLGEPPRLPLRRQFEAVLQQLLLCKAFSSSVAQQVLCVEVVEKFLPEVEHEARVAVQAMLAKLDTLDGE